MPLDPLPRAARAANALTLAGALPFVALALLIPFGPPLARQAGQFALGEQIAWWAGVALVLYAAAILSFLGGIRFGAATVEALRPGARRDIVLSVVPSLAAWGLAIVGMLGQCSGFTAITAVALALLALCFLAQWLWDRASVRADRLPDWFGPMRTRVTAIVAPTLVAAAILIVL